MKHPLEFFPVHLRKPFFFTFLFLTLTIFVLFNFLDQPLRTDASPYGIVSLELARTPQAAQSIMDRWTGRTVIYSDGAHSNAITNAPGEPFLYNAEPMLYAAFGLGLDYLFMRVYGLALSFATLLVAQRRTGRIRSLLILAGYGAFVAALFDAVENYSLFQVLLGRIGSIYPEMAAFCATVKFGLLAFGILVALIGWFFPTQPEGFS
jgi:hypothetical protein